MRTTNFKIVAAWAAIASAAACTDRTPLDAPPSIMSTDSLVPALTGPTFVLAGAGNVARCDRTTDEATARLLDSIPGTVFTTGDNVYASGSAADFQNCYGPSWGRHRLRTRPAPGDLDYQTSAGAAYFNYFGAAAGDVAKGYYSYDLGEWHIVVLNSSLDVSVGSTQEQWLRADLAARSARCTLAYWHHPRFSSYSTYVRADVKPIWDALYEAGAELVVNGHYRMYERFAPQTPEGAADAATGLRQITVGTGGISTNSFGTTQPNSEVRRTGTYGVLKLTLATDAYQWQFVPIAGQTFTESGGGTCHGAARAQAVAVEVTPANASVWVGKTLQLTANAKDASAFPIPNAPMSWRSTDTLTAKVVGGLVTGLAAGTAYVIATSGSFADTAAVSVLPAPVASVAVTPTTASLLIGDAVTLAAVTRDSVGSVLSGRVVTWATSAPAVATIAGGVVTGVTAGQATITATSEGRSASANVTVAAPAPLVRAGWYVSPSGSTANTGRYDRPWTLTYALAGGGGRVLPGDTIWLRGGVYAGEFRSTVRGTAGNPVVVRQYPGERAILDGPAAGTTLRAYGPYSVFWGFELMKSDPSRTTTSTGNHVRGNDVANYSSHTKFLNLVVHDGGVAFYTEDVYTDVEIAGCIIYNNGWQGPDRGHGHALYLKSLLGPVVARDNIIFNQFGYGVHLYSDAGSGQLSNIRLEGNIAFNNGTLSNNSSSANILLGGGAYATGDVVQDNLTYFSPSLSGKNVQIGYGTLRNGSVQVLGNYFAGGSPVLEFGYWSSAVVTGNNFLGTATMVTLKDPTAGLSLTGQILSGLPTTTKVVVRRNPYEVGRANVAVYNWARLGIVAVDLNGIVPIGAAYEIRNVQDLFGAPVVSGTYGGGSVALPIRAVSPPVPVGMSSSRSPGTGIDFSTYIVTLRP